MSYNTPWSGHRPPQHQAAGQPQEFHSLHQTGAATRTNAGQPYSSYQSAYAAAAPTRDPPDEDGDEDDEDGGPSAQIDACAPGRNPDNSSKKAASWKHVCERCGRRFEFLCKLQDHHDLRTKPHRCDQCGKGFGRKPDLNRHVDKRHKESQTMAGVTQASPHSYTPSPYTSNLPPTNSNMRYTLPPMQGPPSHYAGVSLGNAQHAYTGSQPSQYSYSTSHTYTANHTGSNRIQQAPRQLGPYYHSNTN